MTLLPDPDKPEWWDDARKDALYEHHEYMRKLHDKLNVLHELPVDEQNTWLTARTDDMRNRARASGGERAAENDYRVTAVALMAKAYQAAILGDPGSFRLEAYGRKVSLWHMREDRYAECLGVPLTVCAMLMIVQEVMDSLQYNNPKLFPDGSYNSGPYGFGELDPGLQDVMGELAVVESELTGIGEARDKTLVPLLDIVRREVREAMKSEEPVFWHQNDMLDPETAFAEWGAVADRVRLELLGPYKRPEKQPPMCH